VYPVVVPLTIPVVIPFEENFEEGETPTPPTPTPPTPTPPPPMPGFLPGGLPPTPVHRRHQNHRQEAGDS